MLVSQELQERITSGEQLRDKGELEDALEIFSEIVRDYPSLAVGHFKSGTVLARLDRPEDAKLAYRLALGLLPNYPEAANNLGVLLVSRGEWTEAEALFYQAVAERIDYLEVHVNLSDVLQKFGRCVEGLYHARRARAISPTSLLALERLGSMLNSLGRMREAVECIESEIVPATENAPLWSTYAVALQGLGRHSAADSAHSQAVRWAGNEFLPRMNRLYFSNYLSILNEDLWQRHREFGQWLREFSGPVTTDFSELKLDRHRRLRVGIVSGDLRRHSVAYFVPGALGNLDRLRFQLYAYSVSYYSDDVTQRLKPLFNVWRDAAALDHEALYQQIRRDQIDILIDLSGHTNDNRLMVFARRPAPVQVSYLGYPNTTGLDTMDFRITDAIVDPVGKSDEFHSEILWRLNRCFLCYAPPDDAPAVAERPVEAEGIVFGSFNSRAKYSDACLSAWSRLLLRLPGSRLVLKSIVGNGDEAGRRELVDYFVAQGLAADRIDVVAKIPQRLEHLNGYARIDIALDTFPYNGTTTTLEALWMGVPVITLCGDRHAGRVGASVLDALDLSGLVAESVDEFIDIAASLASDPQRQRQLRSTMRSRMQSSPVCDSVDMGRAMGDALRQMWLRYCDAHGADPMARTDTQTGLDEPEKLRLHIGGRETREGWKILNIEPAEGVDFVADVRELSVFDDASCCEIYASHVLEHLGQGEVLPVLNDLYRMLCQGGKLYISVPDLETLAWLMMSPALCTADKFNVMRMLFGGQTTPNDFHHIGFTFDFFVDYLRDVGFESVEQVERLGIFSDTSDMVFAGQRISLNLIAIK